MPAEKYGPDEYKPTEKDIREAKENIVKKYGVNLARADAIEYVKLTSELGYWLTIEKEFSKNGVTEEIVEEIQQFTKKRHGEEISLEEAEKKAEKSLTMTIAHEKEILRDKIREIIAK